MAKHSIQSKTSKTAPNLSRRPGVQSPYTVPSYAIGDDGFNPFHAGDRVSGNALNRLIERIKSL
jgi:hypothetical protein